MLRTVSGFVVRTQNYQETHKIVTLFTEEYGKLSAIARGANKPSSRMVAISQPFVYGNFLVYVSRGLSTLQQGEVISSNREIREDIVKTTYASYIAELTWKTLKDKEPNHYIYQQFYYTIEWIKKNEQAMIPLIMYELKMYKIAGILPMVNQCVSCGETKSLSSFSIVEGGLLCANCTQKDEQAFPLTPTLVKLLQIFVNVGLEQVGNISVKKENEFRIRNILDQYYERYGGFSIKSKNVLNQLDLLQ